LPAGVQSIAALATRLSVLCIPSDTVEPRALDCPARAGGTTVAVKERTWAGSDRAHHITFTSEGS
jgi:hypothetical protein